MFLFEQWNYFSWKKDLTRQSSPRREMPMAAEHPIGLPSPPITNYLVIGTLMRMTALTPLEMKVQVLEMSTAVQHWSASQ